MKVLLGPLNTASQPFYLARALRKHGIDAVSLSYTENDLDYQVDWFVPTGKFNRFDRPRLYGQVLKESLERKFDIYHFFQKSLFWSLPAYSHSGLIGFDIPLLRLRGKRVAYRFTGWELIGYDLERKKNPYSALHHGWESIFDTPLKQEYLDYLSASCDALMVADPMMQEHIPEADIVPRVVPLEDFQEIGIEKASRPLILHAPTAQGVKGSKFILSALKTLKNEGLDFELKTLDRVPHKEALRWIARADLVIDQIHQGWYGVITTEAMAMGKPVAVYLRDDLVKTPEEVPILNINLENVTNRLREAITNFEVREELALRSRDYVARTHDEAVVIPKLVGVYNRIMENPKPVPSSYADIDFLVEQRLLIETMRGPKRSKLRSFIRDSLPDPIVETIHKALNRQR